MRKRPDWHSKLMVPDWIPNGEAEGAKVERFEVSEMGSAVGLFQYGARTPPPGIYTKLTVDGAMMMSDTPAEIRDHMGFVYEAHGRVLIGGLGLGVVLRGCLDRDKAKHVTVIEKSAGVIELVGKPMLEHYEAERKRNRGEPRLKIVQGDVYDFEIPKNDPEWQFDIAWMDVWGNVSTDDLDSMTKLRRKWGRVTVGGAANVRCWFREVLLSRRREERNSMWGYS